MQLRVNDSHGRSTGGTEAITTVCSWLGDLNTRAPTTHALHETDVIITHTHILGKTDKRALLGTILVQRWTLDRLHTSRKLYFAGEGTSKDLTMPDVNPGWRYLYRCKKKPRVHRGRNTGVATIPLTSSAVTSS